MGEEESIDRRKARSRASLRDALLRLAEGRDIAMITVQELSDEANVARATFYLHYANKDELVGEVLDLLFAELSTAGQSFVNAVASHVEAEVGTVVVNLFALLDQRKALYRTLFRTAAGYQLADRLQAFHETALRELWERADVVAEPGTAPLTFRARYIAAAARGIVDLWLSDRLESDAQHAGEWTQGFNMLVMFDRAKMPNPPSS